MNSPSLVFAPRTGQRQGKRAVSWRGREIEASGNGNDPTFVQKKAIVLPTSHARAFSFVRPGKVAPTESERRAPFSLSPTELPFSLFLPRSTFPRGGHPRISVISRAERSGRFFGQGEERTYCTAEKHGDANVRETKHSRSIGEHITK